MQRYYEGELIDLFDEQLERLRGFANPRLASALQFLASKRSVVIETSLKLGRVYDRMPGYTPFVPIIPTSIIGLGDYVTKLRLSVGHGKEDPSLLFPGYVEQEEVSSCGQRSPYFLLGVFFWKDPLIAMSLFQASMVLSVTHRHFVTTHELVATCMQVGYMGEDRVHALGSRYRRPPVPEADGVATLYPNSDEGPKLGLESVYQGSDGIGSVVFYIEKLL